MMNPTMGDLDAPETLIAGLEWHRTHERDANVMLNPRERDAMLRVLAERDALRGLLQDAASVLDYWSCGVQSVTSERVKRKLLPAIFAALANSPHPN